LRSDSHFSSDSLEQMMSSFALLQKASPVRQNKTSPAIKPTLAPKRRQKGHSARLSGDNSLKSIASGNRTLKLGDNGIHVVKLQQALVDMGYFLPKHGVNGDFNDETRSVLIRYQTDTGLMQTGEFDHATIAFMDARFDRRSDYLRAASLFDPAKPQAGTRTISLSQGDAAIDALKPQPDVPGATFNPADGPNYGAEIKQKLSTEIARLHQKNFVDRKELRKDPAKNLFNDTSLEAAANAGKDVTDSVYGNLNKGRPFKVGDNLIDQWTDEIARNAQLAPAEKVAKAANKVEYLVNANCTDVNAKYNATPSDSEEAKVLGPVMKSFVDTPAEVAILLEIDIGWPGAQLDGIQYLQKFKGVSNESNRKRLWRLFHVSIHEYIHALAHKDYIDWAAKISGSKEHSLIEGFCDFFTLNVRAKYPPSALKTYKPRIEGPFYDATAPIPSASEAKVGVYSSNAQAERMVAIIGIINAQLGYFKGKTILMGGR
jgi:peptidoglycan hydrolase-like protein with peptidoglycan-binding domain